MANVDDPDNIRAFLEAMKRPLPFIQQSRYVPSTSLREEKAEDDPESPIDQMTMGTILPPRDVNNKSHPYSSDKEAHAETERKKEVTNNDHSVGYQSETVKILNMTSDHDFGIETPKTPSMSSDFNHNMPIHGDQYKHSTSIQKGVKNSYHSGLHAPPPTPEVNAMFTNRDSQNDQQDLDVIGLHIGSYLANAAKEDLKASIHAPRSNRPALWPAAKLQKPSTNRGDFEQSGSGLQSAITQSHLHQHQQFPKPGLIGRDHNRKPHCAESSKTQLNRPRTISFDFEKIEVPTEFASEGDDFEKVEPDDLEEPLQRPGMLVSELSDCELVGPESLHIQEMQRTFLAFQTSARGKYSNLKQTKPEENISEVLAENTAESTAALASESDNTEPLLTFPESKPLSAHIAEPYAPLKSQSEMKPTRAEASLPSIIGQSIAFVRDSMSGKGRISENRDHRKTVIENYTEKIVPQFVKWPTVEKRSGAAAQVRTVRITNLPVTQTPKLVASLVYGGGLEKVASCTPTTALVSFLNAEECKRFYDTTGNGLIYGTDQGGKKLVAFVQLGQDVDVVGGLLRSMIERGATRCITAVGSYTDTDEDAHTRLLLPHMSRFKFEHISRSKESSECERLTFRLCSIQEAVMFHGVLSRHEDWEAFNIFYSPDPCALAKDDGKRLALFE